jgi:DNA-directed RNA polymerase subunit beta'
MDLRKSPANEINPPLVRRVESEIKALFPITSSRGDVKIDAESVEIDTKGFDPTDLNAQQRARETGGTRSVPIMATVTLERDGKQVQKHRIKLGSLPLAGFLGSFTHKGNDYFAPLAQARLKSGAYTREKENGEFETFIKIQGPTMRVWMEPSRGIFKLAHRSTNVDLIPLLMAMGISETDLIRGLGNDRRARELVAKNKRANAERDIDKLYSSMYEQKQDQNLVKAGIIPSGTSVNEMTQAQKVAAIKLWLSDKALDSFVTERTLGKGFETLSARMLLAAARRILAVQRGDEDPDDRDAPQYKKVVGIEDLMGERISRLKKMLHRDALKVIERDPGASLGKIFGSNWADVATVGYFGGMRGIEGGLAHTTEAANPLAILSERSKITVKGEGGIQSDHAITEGARLFRPAASNFIDAVHTPEGGQVGIMTHGAWNVRRRKGTLESVFYKVVNGKVDRSKLVHLSIEKATKAVVGYPEFWNKDGTPKFEVIEDEDGKSQTLDTVRAIKNDEVVTVHPSEVEYVIPSGASMFDHTSNAALFFANTHPNRGMMAGKHLTQALPLLKREKPLVRLTDAEGKEDVLRKLAQSFVIRARIAGEVEVVNEEVIVVNGVKHTLYNHYPMQAKVSLHHTPVVKVGDKVRKGQVLADSNYSQEGTLTLGVNLRSAYMPWKNAGNFEDAIVVSESAAEKLTSEHLHRERLRVTDETLLDRKLFVAQYPTLISKENESKLDSKGIIKKGSRVTPGEILVAAVRKKKVEDRDRSHVNLSNIHKTLIRPYADESLVWDELYPGEVIRVVRHSDYIEVHVRTEEPLQVGDKLSMSSAAKGTISDIVPDDKMPQDERGNHIEAIFNPHGVAGRMNPSQTIEQAAGKLVRDGGEEYSHAIFDGVDHAAEVAKRLKAKGLKHAEILYDPETGRKIERPVATGYNYVFKLDHPVRKKFSARTRDGYTLDETPTQGKGKGGQAYDHLTTYALLGHDAHAILGESYGIRGTKNDDFWLAYQAGETPPPPKVPFAFEKFRHYLNAAGVDTQQRGDTLHYLPLSDKRIRDLSHGEIQNARQIRAKDLAEEKGGLFDPHTTGGLYGENWSHIDLGRKVPHPLYEKVLRDVLGIKQAEFYGLLAHTMHLDPKTGKITGEQTRDTITGDKAFEKLLDFDVDTKLADVKRRLKTAVGSDKNRLHRASRYLRGLKTTKMSPAEAYLTQYIPVIPPKYRAITEMSGGNLSVAPANTLYRDVLMTKQVLKDAERDGSLPQEELGKARVALYDAYSALIGVSKPLTKKRDEDLRGFIEVIKGKSNKTGLFQQQLSRRRNDYTGRSTIEPDADLGMDEIGLPEDMAWKIYEPTVVRRLVQLGWKPADALKEVKKRTIVARGALKAELDHRPVIYNRAPSLHRWNAVAAKARLTSGKEIKISPLAIDGQNIDFDGDTVAIHVPITEEARRESHNLLPTKNMYYDRDRSLAYGPGKDVIAGIFALTRKGRPTGLKYDSSVDAINDFKNNRKGLRMDSQVVVKDFPGRPTIGQLIFFDLIPERYRKGITFPITKDRMNKILEAVAKQSPAEYARITRVMTQVGFKSVAAAGGVTATVDELAMNRGKVKLLLKQFEKDLERYKNKTKKEQSTGAEELYESKYKKKIDKLVLDHVNKQEVGYKDIMESGSSSKANPDQFRQIFASPTLVRDVNGRTVPGVIQSSYSEGMRPSDYIMTTPGARAGIVSRSLSTALPGFLAKEIAGNMGPVRVGEEDCGTHKGIDVEVDSKLKNHDADLLDRHLATDVMGTKFKRNDIVTPTMLSALRDKKIKTIKVRSAMTCEASSPPCSMCAGRDPSGKLHQVGANIGYNYGQAASERSTQLTMRSFHSGGTVGSGDSLTAGFQRLRELLAAPAIVRDQGTLSDVDGTVVSVRPAPQGGYYITVGTTEHYIQSGRTPKVKQGQQVKKGDPLSDGNYRPQDIAEKRSLLDAQKYVVDEARKAYQAAGATVRKPVLEVLAAGTMRYVEVTDDGGEDDLAIGDVLSETEYDKRRRMNGRIMAKPTIIGLSQKPIKTSNDLLERLNFQRLEDAVREAPATGSASDLTGSKSPIPGLAYGASFRKNEKPDMFRDHYMD